MTMAFQQPKFTSCKILASLFSLKIITLDLSELFELEQAIKVKDRNKERTNFFIFIYKNKIGAIEKT